MRLKKGSGTKDFSRITYRNGNLYKDNYLHSSYFTFRANSQISFKSFQNLSTKKILNKQIKTAKSNFQSLCASLGKGEKELLALLRQKSSSSSIDKLINDYYNNGEKILNEFLASSTREELESMLVESINASSTQQKVKTGEIQISSLSEKQKKELRKNFIKNSKLTSTQQTALSIFLAGNESQGFLNFCNLLIALDTGAKQLRGVPLSDVMNNGLESVLKGIVNEKGAQLRIEELSEQNLINQVTAVVKGGKKNNRLKTQKADIVIYSSLGNEVLGAMSSKTIPVIKGKYFSFKLEETNSLDWIIDRFKVLSKGLLNKNYFDFLQYLIVNTTYLNKVGGYSRDGIQKVNQSMMQDYIDFINSSFAAYAGVFAGSESFNGEEAKNGIIIDTANGIAIPIYKVLEEIQSKLLNENFVKITFEMKRLDKNAKVIRQEKLTAAKGYKSGYPKKMIQIGSQYGNLAKSNISAKIRLNGLYSLIEKLNR